MFKKIACKLSEECSQKAMDFLLTKKKTQNWKEESPASWTRGLDINPETDKIRWPIQTYL